MTKPFRLGEGRGSDYEPIMIPAPAFKGEPSPGVPVAEVIREAEALEKDARPRLVCVRCGHPITSSRARAEIAGSHVHSRVNPIGIEYRFGCFSAAPGAAVSGIPTLEHSWFPASAWQYAHCAACGVHLGWFFSGAESFHALILDRLREEKAEG